jgi:hypothetical protein
VADDIAEHAAWPLRQRCRQPIEADRFQRSARQQHQRETDGAEHERMIARMIGAHDAAIARDDEHDSGNDPPPRGEPEQVQQEIRHPRADDAAAIGDRTAGTGRRPACVALRVGDERQREVEECCDDQQPP